MNKYLSLLLMIFFLPLIGGCSTSPVNTATNSIVISSLSVTPKIVPPGGFVLISIEAFDAAGNELFYRVGSGETRSLKDNKKTIVQVPPAAGSQEMTFMFSNGRQDVYQSVEIVADNSLISSIGHGTVELPINKSFDVLSGTIKDKYYGDIDYCQDRYAWRYCFGLIGSGSGNALPGEYFDGGIINLTYYSGKNDLSKVTAPYDGYYYNYVWKYADSSEEHYWPEQALAAGNVYCLWLGKNGNNYFALIKVKELDAEKIVFEYVAQKDAGKEGFYD